MSILGYSQQEMDIHYIVPEEDMLKEAMKKNSRQLDEQGEKVNANLGQTNISN